MNEFDKIYQQYEQRRDFLFELERKVNEEGRIDLQIPEEFIQQIEGDEE